MAVPKQGDTLDFMILNGDFGIQRDRQQGWGS